MTQDNGMDTTPSWQELKDGRDSWRRVAERLEGERQAAEVKADEWEELAYQYQRERDALAAQVRAARCIAVRWQGNDDNIGHVLSALEVWALRVDHDPSGELARLKAQWQAEALEAAAPGMVSEHDKLRLERWANTVRRRAEGGDA